MTTPTWWPQLGDAVVELTRAGRTGVADQLGKPVTIKTVTHTTVVTSDGKLYDRMLGYPIAQGSRSPRRLLPTSDVRVLTARGREQLAKVARFAANLAALDRKTPEECGAALAALIATAHQARGDLVRLMADASRREQESDR